MPATAVRYRPNRLSETAPIGLAAAFHTPDEIFGAPLSADYTERQLQRVPVKVVLRFCAMVLTP